MPDDNIPTLTFRASIAPIMSGIRVGLDGMRLQLDIPESDMSKAAALLALRGVGLLVTVAVEPLINNAGSRHNEDLSVETRHVGEPEGSPTEGTRPDGPPGSGGPKKDANGWRQARVAQRGTR